MRIRRRFYCRIVEFRCMRCGGTGLLGSDTICTFCDGKGYYYREVDD